MSATPRQGVDLWLTRIEATLLSLLLFGILGLTGAQIVLRNAGSASLAGMDPLIRASVLWLGLIGAVAAAREFRHIRIDLVARVLPERWAAVADALVAAVTAAVCALIAWHGGRMVLDEREFGTTFGNLAPAWVLQTVIPVSFALMALIYAVHIVLRLRRAVRKS